MHVCDTGISLSIDTYSAGEDIPSSCGQKCPSLLSWSPTIWCYPEPVKTSSHLHDIFV